jgi:hypothetical protein
VSSSNWIFISVCISLLSMGCAGGPSTKKNWGLSNPDFLTGEKPVEKISAIKDDLSRDLNRSYFPYYLWVRATLRSQPYVLTQLRNEVADLAYKEKWDDKKRIQVYNSMLKAQLTKLQKSTCFDIEVRTNDSFANSPANWHGDLRTDGASEVIPVTFEPFAGFTEKTTSAYVTGSTVNVSEERDHFMFTEACSAKPIDFTKEFTFEVQPRFKKDIKALRLRWGKRETNN